MLISSVITEKEWTNENYTRMTAKILIMQHCAAISAIAEPLFGSAD